VTSRVTARLCACRGTPRHDEFADSWFKTSDLSYFDEEIAAAGTDTETETGGLPIPENSLRILHLNQAEQLRNVFEPVDFLKRGRLQ